MLSIKPPLESTLGRLSNLRETGTGHVATHEGRQELEPPRLKAEEDSSAPQRSFCVQRPALFCRGAARLARQLETPHISRVSVLERRCKTRQASEPLQDGLAAILLQGRASCSHYLEEGFGLLSSIAIISIFPSRKKGD